MNSEAYPIVAEAAKREGLQLKLVEGKGDDPDTLGKKIVWVMDTAKFPFIQGEVYHQYHGNGQLLQFLIQCSIHNFEYQKPPTIMIFIALLLNSALLYLSLHCRPSPLIRSHVV
jgi:hypothetical protein